MKQTITTIALCLCITSCAHHASHNFEQPNTTNKTAHRVYKRLPNYSQLATLPWPTIHPKKLPLKAGMSDPAIVSIRKRLNLLGDLPSQLASNPKEYDQQLSDAVAQFQWRHGLKQDGELGENTLHALNVPPAARLQQLAKSMHEWAKFPENEGSRYLRINVASFRLNLIKNGQKIIEMKVVAGKPSRPTPEIYSKIQTIVLNPTWNVPHKIIKKDIIPKVLEDPNYLVENNMNIYSNWAKNAYKVDPKSINWPNAQHQRFPYRLTQEPGDDNALGRVKFVFLNDHDVYLHDTPQKGLFAKLQRAFSSGCIRLEKPFELVEYFIKENDKDHLTNENVEKYLMSGKTKYLKISNPIPIYITYITAWVDEQGYTHFREDIYRRKMTQ